MYTNYINWTSLLKSSWHVGKERLKNILQSDEARNEFLQSEEAVLLVYGHDPEDPDANSDALWELATSDREWVDKACRSCFLNFFVDGDVDADTILSDYNMSLRIVQDPIAWHTIKRSNEILRTMAVLLKDNQEVVRKIALDRDSLENVIDIDSVATAISSDTELLSELCASTDGRFEKVVSNKIISSAILISETAIAALCENTDNFATAMVISGFEEAVAANSTAIEKIRTEIKLFKKSADSEVIMRSVLDDNPSTIEAIMGNLYMKNEMLIHEVSSRVACELPGMATNIRDDYGAKHILANSEEGMLGVFNSTVAISNLLSDYDYTAVDASSVKKINFFSYDFGFGKTHLAAALRSSYGAEWVHANITSALHNATVELLRTSQGSDYLQLMSTPRNAKIFLENASFVSEFFKTRLYNKNVRHLEFTRKLIMESPGKEIWDNLSEDFFVTVINKAAGTSYTTLNDAVSNNTSKDIVLNLILLSKTVSESYFNSGLSLAYYLSDIFVTVYNNVSTRSIVTESAFYKTVKNFSGEELISWFKRAGVSGEYETINDVFGALSDRKLYSFSNIPSTSESLYLSIVAAVNEEALDLLFSSADILDAHFEGAISSTSASFESGFISRIFVERMVRDENILKTILLSDEFKKVFTTLWNLYFKEYYSILIETLENSNLFDKKNYALPCSYYKNNANYKHFVLTSDGPVEVNYGNQSENTYPYTPDKTNGLALLEVPVIKSHSSKYDAASQTYTIKVLVSSTYTRSLQKKSHNGSYTDSAKNLSLISIFPIDETYTLHSGYSGDIKDYDPNKPTATLIGLCGIYISGGYTSRATVWKPKTDGETEEPAQ